MALDDIQRHLAWKLQGIPQDGDLLGAAGAPAHLTYWGDLQCPHCRDFVNHDLMELVQQEVRAGVVTLRYRPLETTTRDRGEFVAQQAAAWAAGRQGRLWEFMETFHLSQQEADSGYVTDRFLRAIADEIPELDLERWERDRRTDLTDHLAESDRQARAAGVTGSPGLVLEADGRRRGPLRPTIYDLLDAVDELLA